MPDIIYRPGSGGGSGSGTVLSVFGRTGDVGAQSNDYSFGQIGSKPTTLSGYGITDGVPTTRSLLTGTGLEGGGNLSANRTLALTAAAIASLALADTAVQPPAIADFETTTQLDARDTANRSRTNHTGTQAISTVSGLQTALDGKVDDADIADFETTTQLNARDTANRDRANHTGTQLAATISDLSAIATAGVGVGILADQKAQGVAGGTFTQGAWQVRDLNTVLLGASWLSLNSSTGVFTLNAPGQYLIVATAPGFSVAGHAARLTQTAGTGTLNTGIGSTARVAGSVLAQTDSWVFGFATVGAGQTLSARVEHRCTSTTSSNGFGSPADLAGRAEIYAQVMILKVA